MDKTQIARGACLCGAINVDIDLPPKWVAHCHCTQCQHAHGAAFVTWVGVSEPAARISDPEQQLQWFASSQAARRGFCRRCGSSLFFTSSRWPGELHIVRACFHDPIAQLPMAHVFYDTHVDWFEVRDNLPKKKAAQEVG